MVVHSTNMYDFSLLRSKFPILETAENFLPSLKKKGNLYVSLCPFHNEKTPSFTIYANKTADKQSFYCFGCGASGDVFDLIEHFQGSDSLKELLKKESESLVPRTRNFTEEEEEEEKEEEEEIVTFPEQDDIIFDKNILYDLTSSLFDDYPNAKRVLSYAQSRFSDTAIHTFRLGCISPSFLKKIDEEYSRTLASPNLNFLTSPRWIGRLIFPIISERGNLVGFSGRAVDERVRPKYLFNPGFRKNLYFFGENFVSEETPPNKNILFFVEGPADVLALQRAGYSAVATLGTNFYGAKLSNYLQKVGKSVYFSYGLQESREIDKMLNLPINYHQENFCIFWFDGDDAGVNVSQILNPYNPHTPFSFTSHLKYLRVFKSPKNMDPYEFLQNFEKKKILTNYLKKMLEKKNDYFDVTNFRVDLAALPS